MKFFDRTLIVAAGLLITAVLIVVVLQVVMRYVFNAPTVWSEELATLLFVWFVMLGIPPTLYHQEHIKVEVLTELPVKWLTRSLHVFGNLMFALLFAIVGYLALQIMGSADRQLMSGLSQAFGLSIHLNAIYWALPVGSAFAVLFAIEQIIFPRPAIAHKPEQS